MKKSDMLFIAGVIVVVVALYFLSMSGKKPPPIPPDMQHMAATTKEACKECHAVGKVKPMNPHHPFKDDCFKCHSMKKNGHGVMQ